MANDISVLLGVEGAAAYNKEMQSIISQTKLLDSEMKLVASAFAKGEVSEKKSAQTKAVLEKQIANQSKRLEELKKVLEAAKAQYGENSEQTQKWQIEVNKAEAALNKMEVQLRQTDDELDEFANSSSKFSGSKFASALSGVGNAAKAVGKGVGVVALNTGKVLADGAVKLAKFAAVGTGAIAAGMAAGIKKSIELEAEFEQVSDGAKLLFGGAYDYIAGKAEEAYKTVQMSQSEYLTAVNGYAVGLREAMGGTEEAGQAAAVLADKIITAQADIVSATGRDAESVADAFSGIMRGNYQMLDNLGLGIAGTKEGLQTVIDKVNDWKAANGDATRYVMGNYADMESALIDYVEMQGLSGYASKEAMHTIEGSLKATKSAWKNTLTALTSNNGNLKKSIKDLSESAIAFTKNITPRISKALSGFGEIIDGIAPIIAQELPSLLKKLIPQATNVARNLVNSLKTSLPTITQEIVPELISGAKTVVNSLLDVLPDLIDVASDLIGGFINSILADDNVDSLIDSAVKIVGALGSGLIDNAGKLADAAVEIIGKLTEKLLTTENAQSLADSAVDIVTKISDSLTGSDGIAKIGTGAAEFITEFVLKLFDAENVKKLTDAGGKIAAYIVAGVGASVDQAIADTLRFFGLEKVADYIEKTIETGKRSMRDPSFNRLAYGSGESAGESYGNGMVNGIGEKSGTVKDAYVDTATDAASSGVEAALQVVDDAQGDFYQSSYDAIAAGSRGVSDANSKNLRPTAKTVYNTLLEAKISKTATETWGKDMLDGLTSGLSNRDKRAALRHAVNLVADDMYTTLHFSKPDRGPLRDYEKWMPDFMAGLAKGIEQNRYKVQNAIDKVAGGMAITVKGSTAASRTTNMGGVVVNVYGAAGQDVNSLADEVMNRINNAVNERGAVWA